MKTRPQASTVRVVLPPARTVYIIEVPESAEVHLVAPEGFETCMGRLERRAVRVWTRRKGKPR